MVQIHYWRCIQLRRIAYGRGIVGYHGGYTKLYVYEVHRGHWSVLLFDLWVGSAVCWYDFRQIQAKSFTNYSLCAVEFDIICQYVGSYIFYDC